MTHMHTERHTHRRVLAYR